MNIVSTILSGLYCQNTGTKDLGLVVRRLDSAIHSDLFKLCKNFRKTTELQRCAWQIIKEKINFKIPKLYLVEADLWLF